MRQPFACIIHVLTLSIAAGQCSRHSDPGILSIHAVKLEMYAAGQAILIKALDTFMTYEFGKDDGKCFVEGS